MRANRNKDFDDPPASLKQAKGKCEHIATSGDLSAIDELIFKGSKITITDDPTDYYYGKKEYEVRYKLRILFHNKCAYCERTEYKPDIEHYRPKKKVTGIQRNNHGYYWLCYEWTNLIPACRDCNSQGGKWNKFPLLNGGQRVTQPPLNQDGRLDFDKCKADNQYLLDELPCILHPEIDRPEDYFKMEWNGKLAAVKSGHNRGYHTIKSCDLNRGNLIKGRKSIIDDYAEQFLSAFQLFRIDAYSKPEAFTSALEIIIEHIQEKKSPKYPFSFVSLYIWENFASFVHNRLKALDKIEQNLLISCRDNFTN